MYYDQASYPAYPAYPAAYSGHPAPYPAYPTAYPAVPHAANPGSYPAVPVPTLLQAAAAGAIVGGSAAAAINLRRMQRQEISGQEAVISTLKAGASTAFVSAAASMVAGYVGGSPITRAVTLFAAGTAITYLLDYTP